MPLVLNEEQAMLQESARDFLNSRAPVSHLRTLRDERSETGFSRELWREMSDMAWPAMGIPESHGGLGFGFTGLGLVLQECGRTLTPSPLLASALMSAATLARFGSEEQKSELLPAVAAGEQIVTLAVDEQAQHRPEHVSTRMGRSGSGIVLNGSKQFVLDGMAADVFLVSARSGGKRDDPQGISLLLVSRSLPGVSVTRFQALDTQVLAEVEFSDVQLSETALVGKEHEGHALLEFALDTARIGQSAELLGVAIEAFERSLEYLKERKQFGQPIGSFQALQHRAAIVFGEIEMCKSLVLNALQLLDDHAEISATERAEIASRTKSKMAETALLTTAEAIQWHGGIGMTDDFDIGLFYKRARLLDSLLGDHHFQLDRYARVRGY